MRLVVASLIVLLFASTAIAQDLPGGGTESGMDAAFYQIEAADFPNQKITVTTLIVPQLFKDSLVNPLHKAPDVGDFVLIQLWDMRVGKVAQKTIELKAPADIPFPQLLQTERLTAELMMGNDWGGGGLKVRIVWPKNGSAEAGTLQLNGNGWAISDSSINPAQ